MSGYKQAVHAPNLCSQNWESCGQRKWGRYMFRMCNNNMIIVMMLIKMIIVMIIIIVVVVVI